MSLDREVYSAAASNNFMKVSIFSWKRHSINGTEFVLFANELAHNLWNLTCKFDIVIPYKIFFILNRKTFKDILTQKPINNSNS